MAHRDVFWRWWASPQADDEIEISLDGTSVQRSSRRLLFSIVNGAASFGPNAPKVFNEGWLRSGDVNLSIAEAWVVDQPVGAHEVHLRFEDGTEAVLGRDDEPAPKDARVLDRGAALLEPVTLSEYQGIETIIGELFAAAGTGGLSDADERRILQLADLIRWQHRETTPGVTQRWQLVGTVRSVVLKLAAEVPIALAANEIALKLHEVGWHDLATALGQIPL